MYIYSATWWSCGTCKTMLVHWFLHYQAVVKKKKKGNKSRVENYSIEIEFLSKVGPSKCFQKYVMTWYFSILKFVDGRIVWYLWTQMWNVWNFAQHESQWNVVWWSLAFKMILPDIFEFLIRILTYT